MDSSLSEFRGFQNDSPREASIYCAFFKLSLIYGSEKNILFSISVNRKVVNMWKGSNPDRNANKTTADVVLALKQYKQITQQPQNSASTRARYDAFSNKFMEKFPLYFRFWAKFATLIGLSKGVIVYLTILFLNLFLVFAMLHCVV